MLILTAMLLMGLLAATWGFLICFMPARFSRLMQIASFSDLWTVPSAKRQVPIVGFIVRACNCAAGLVIFAAGIWFTCVAASEIYRVLVGHAVIRSIPRSSGTVASAPSPVLTAFSVFMIAVGVLLAIFPGKAIAAANHVWPDGRSITHSAAPRVRLLLRLFGAALAFMAGMSLPR